MLFDIMNVFILLYFSHRVCCHFFWVSIPKIDIGYGLLLSFKLNPLNCLIYVKPLAPVSFEHHCMLHILHIP